VTELILGLGHYNLLVHRETTYHPPVRFQGKQNKQTKRNNQSSRRFNMFSRSNKSPAETINSQKETNIVLPETPRLASSKITDRLNKVMESTSPLNKNRSPDLVPLTAEYEQMRQKLRALVAAVKTYKMRIRAMNEAKFEVSIHKGIDG
jgi:hypothetical protein